MRHKTTLCCLLAMLAFVPGVGADTLAHVRERGTLLCGVNEGLPGFSESDAAGLWSGIDVDLCRAVAAAVLGQAAAVTFVPLTAQDRFAALRSREIDLLVRNTTWTLSRDAGQEVDFAGVNYFDGQAFMTRADRDLRSVMDLDGARICVTQGTTTQSNLEDYFRLRGMRYEAVTFVRLPEMFAAYDAGFCDVLTADQSSLTVNRSRLSDPQAHLLLPEVISREPLGPAVRHGDDAWLDVVRWTLFALLVAEEHGVSSGNAGRMRASSTHAEVRRLLGVEGKLGEELALAPDWAYQVVVQVGNYAESFERNLGRGSAFKLRRGLNALWTEGGLMYAMPFR